MPRRTFLEALRRFKREGASMRPGRNAPENASHQGLDNPQAPSFNEAGAKCPGERPVRARGDPRKRRFNEAGAKCPGERRAGRQIAARPDRFNEAGAKCPGERRQRHLVGRAFAASMRPGRNAPENVACSESIENHRCCFNEAGAKCPGEPRAPTSSTSTSCMLQ